MNFESVEKKTERVFNDSYKLKNENGLKSLLIYNNFTNFGFFIFILFLYIFLRIFYFKRGWYKLLEWNVFIGDLYS